MHLDHLYVP